MPTSFRRLLSFALVLFILLSAFSLPRPALATFTTISVTDNSLADWTPVKTVLSDPVGDVNGSGQYDFVKMWVANDSNNLYVRWDIQLAANNTSITSAAYGIFLNTTGSNSATPNAVGWVQFDSHGNMTVLVENPIGTAHTVTGANAEQFFTGSTHAVASIEAQFPLASLGLSLSSVIPLWGESHPSASTNSTVKDRIPDSGYMLTKIQDGSWTPVGVGPMVVPTLSVSPTTVAPSGTVTYTLYLENDGDGPTTISNIMAQLPTGAAYVCGSSSGATTLDPTTGATCPAGGNNLTWSLGSVSLAPGASLTESFQVVAPSATGSYYSNAQFTAGYTTSMQTGDTALLQVQASGAPTLAAYSNQSSNESDVVNLAAANATGSSLTWSATGLPPGVSINPSTGQITGTLSTTSAGTYTVTVTVQNSSGSANQTFTWTVVDNTIPTLGAYTNQSNTAGATVTLNSPTAADADNDVLTWSATGLPSGLSINSSTGVISGTLPGTAGTYSVSVTVTDSAGNQASQPFTWTVTAAATAPAVQNTSATVGQAQYSILLTGSDTAGSTLNFTVNQPAHGSVSLATSSCTIAAGQTSCQVTANYTTTSGYAGADSFTFSATNTGDSLTSNQGTVSLNVLAMPTAQGKTVTLPPAGGAITLTAGDTAGSTLTLAIGTPPAHGTVTLTTNSCTVAAGQTTCQVTATYTPNAGYAGADSFTFTANDGVQTSTPATINLTVTDITLGAYSTQSSAEGATINLVAPTVVHADGDTLTWSATGLPQGLSINPSNGNITGTVAYTAAEQGTPPGAYSVTVTVADPAGNKAQQTFTWTVTDTDTTPTLNAYANQSSAEGASATLNPPAASDADGDVLTWSATGLPQGLSINATTGVISGTLPYTAAEQGTPAGTYSVTVTVADPAGHKAQQPFTWTVLDTNTAPTLSPYQNQNGIESGSISIAGTPASDVDGDTLTWSATGLPPGVSMNPTTGLISGTPSYGTAGSYTVKVTVTDAGGLSASQTFTLSISPAPANGSIFGTVKTDTGRVAPGVTMELLSSGGSTVATATTDSQGNYYFAALSGGAYTVQVDWGPNPITQSVNLPGHGVVQQNFTVASVAALSLAANPSSLVGDGKSTSILTATLTAKDGSTVSGVPVQFTATAGTLSSGGATSDAKGQANVTLTAPVIGGVIARTESATAHVYDPQHGIAADQSITITFLPATLQGIVTDGITGKPVAGAVVKVAEDFNGDGVIDFTAQVTTGADGRYSIVVPRGDWSYHITVLTPVQINGRTVMVQSQQNGQVGSLSGTGEKVAAQRSIAGQVLLLGNAGQTQQAGGAMPAGVKLVGSIKAADGSPVNATVTVNSNGSYQVNNVPNGSYRLTFSVVAPSGQTLVGASIPVQVNADGQLAVSTPLIDPYGVVTDAVTGKPISGVKMSLYYADTALNQQSGHTPGTLVPLPALPWFPPNQNAVPQLTTTDGQYAWLVFPNADYYVVAEKAGYNTYDSRQSNLNVPAAPGTDSSITGGIIHVGSSVVQLNVSLTPASTAGGTTSGGTSSGGATQPTGGTGSTGDTGGTGGAPTEQQHRKYIAGYPDGTFGPNRSITRAEVATILYRILELQHMTPTQAPYPDVAVTHWAAGYITQVTQAGLMKGYPDGSFHPEAPITRAEIAAVLVRFKHLNPVAAVAFNDVAGHWAQDVIAAAAQAQIVTGYPGGSFKPNQSMTRAEFVTAVNRALGRGPLVGLPAPTWPDVTQSHWAWGMVEEASISHYSVQEATDERFVRKGDLDIWR